jgi:polysaccharide biosynthesis/export protein
MRRFCGFLTLVAIGFALMGLTGPSIFAQERYDQQGGAQRVPRVENQQSPDQTAPSQPQTAATAGPDYIIGPEDVLKIDVFQVPELSNLLVRVTNDGTITVPLVGQVVASGLTVKELSEKLQSAWGQNYLQNPEVTVFVHEFQAKPVSVVGEVQKPGLYYLTGPRKLIDMLSMAGGLAQQFGAGAGPSVYVTRQNGFRNLPSAQGMHLVAPDKVEINIRMLLYSREAALNIQIKPLDVISVSRADVVYVTGRGIQKPGGFILQDRDSVTVFQALAMAEGLSASADKHDARIIRHSADGSRVVIPVDLDKVEKGKVPDPVLSANDILFVPDSRQRTALKRAIDTTVATVSGLLIFGRL